MENDHTKEHPMRVQLRRYPNRRYYDAARSQHLTLEDIFRLISEGHQVQGSLLRTVKGMTHLAILLHAMVLARRVSSEVD